MPEVSRPHPLDGVTSRELTENGVDAVAKTAQEGAFLRSRISFLRGVRSQKVYAHPRQFLLRLGRMVVAIPDSDPRVDSASSGTMESSWMLAGATEKRVMTPGQQTLACILKP